MFGDVRGERSVGPVDVVVGASVNGGGEVDGRDRHATNPTDIAWWPSADVYGNQANPTYTSPVTTYKSRKFTGTLNKVTITTRE